MSRCSSLDSLEKSFVNWACTAAGRYGRASVEKVLSVLQGLPEDAHNLRATIVGHFNKLMDTTETMALCLPHYYSALVGPSQLVRSRAAKTLGDMSRQTLENFPDLVFEAFSALLNDPYVIVHRAAVKTLERFQLPPTFDADAKGALAGWILSYAKNPSRDSSADAFLMETIDLYAHRYASDSDRAGRLGEKLLSIAQTVEPSAVAREFQYSGRSFFANPSYAGLLFKLIDDEKSMSLYHEDLIGQLDKLSDQTIHRERASAMALGKKVAKHYPQIGGVLIEVLSAAGAWKEATELATATYNDIEDTTRTKPFRLHAALRMIACSYESAIADGQMYELEGLSGRWKATLMEIENDRAANQARRNPLHGFFGAN
jgi:hypothetical protein